MASVNNHETRITNTENNLNTKVSNTFLQNQSTNTCNSAFGVGVVARYLSSTATGKPTGNDHALLSLAYSSDWFYQLAGDWRTDNLYVRGSNNSAASPRAWRKVWLQGDAITNAVWNDYAERFEKPVELKTEPGDIIALDKSTETEMYKLAEEGDSNIVGVHSDEYGMLIGGVADDEEYNKKHFIPVGMIGRVRTKVIGPIHKGDRIVPSNIPGVGRIFENGDNMFAIVGFATETNLDPNIKKVRTKINTY